MATVRYIRTTADAGGNGTTDTDSSGDGSHAYQSLNAAEASEGGGTLSDVLELVCTGAQDSTTVTFDGTTTSASNYILVRISDADNTSGVFSATSYFLDMGTGAGQAVDIRDDHVRFQGIQFRRDSLSSSSSARNCIRCTVLATGSEIYFTDVIFKSIAPSITGVISALALTDSDPTYRIKNCVAYDFSGTSDVAFNYSGASGTYKTYNNTIENCTTGIVTQSGDTIVNNIFQNCTTDVSGTPSGSSDWNLTDSVTKPVGGTNDIPNTTLTFVNLAGEDYHLASGDENNGLSNGSDSEVPTTDVDGDTRTNYHIGFDELIAAAESIPPGTLRLTAITPKQTMLQIHKVPAHGT